jgi:transcription antitermination factor NusG
VEREDHFDWFVVKTNSRAEKRVFERIEKLGFQVYLPLVESIKQWSDRKKKIHTPLIPSTLFVKSKASELSKLYDIQGFHYILQYLKKPAIVREFEIDNLKILLKESDSLELFHELGLTPGDKVEVTRGPFQGLIATSLEVNRTHKLIVEIESLEQRFVVHVPKSFVRKL